MASWIERFLNVLIVFALATIIGSVAVRGLRWLERPHAPPSDGRSEFRGVKPVQYVRGDRLPQLDGVDYAKTPATIVLFLATHCQYCINNMEFYRELAGNKGRKRGVFQLIVAGAEPLATLSTFLGQHRLEADGVVSSAGSEVKVWGTPTLIVADRAGVVERVWVGEQGLTGRAQILGLLENAESIREGP